MKVIPKTLLLLAIGGCLTLISAILLLTVFPKTVLQKKINSPSLQQTPFLFAQLKQPVFLQERIFTLVFLQKNFPATGTDDVLSTQQFIAATVSIENTGNRILDYSPYDFFIQNKTGQLSAPVFTFKLADEYMLGSGKLAPKAKKTGIIVFVIEKSEAPFLLLYKPFTVNQQQPAAGIQL